MQTLMMKPSKQTYQSAFRRKFEIFRALSQLAKQNSVFCVIQSELSNPDRHTGRQ